MDAQKEYWRNITWLNQDVESYARAAHTGNPWDAKAAPTSKPLLGELPHKSLLRGEKHAHCGQCPTFPCQQLTAYAYDPEQGDNGLRLEQCRKWREEV